MGVFTFVLRTSGGEWSAKQQNGDLEASAPSTFELLRKLVQSALSSDASGGVQTSYSPVTPTSAVFQVIIGGAGGGGGGGGGGAFIGGGPAAAPAAPGGGAEAPPAEEKKEEKEESDDDMGFSLFD